METRHSHPGLRILARIIAKRLLDGYNVRQDLPDPKSEEGSQDLGAGVKQTETTSDYPRRGDPNFGDETNEC